MGVGVGTGGVEDGVIIGVWAAGTGGVCVGDGDGTGVIVLVLGVMQVLVFGVWAHVFGQ